MSNGRNEADERIPCSKAEHCTTWAAILRQPSIGTMSWAQIITAALLFIVLLVSLTLRTRHATQEDYLPGIAVADKLTNSWETNHNLLATYEQQQSKLRMAVIEKRKRYRNGEIPESEVIEAEQSFVAVLARIQEIRRLMAEAEIAIAETEMKDESPSTSILTFDGFGQTNASVPYRQGEPWSLKQAQSIETYFYQTFGHHLPVSAFGQTATHDRLGFDHRNAMDVAVYPDSVEGKALINYLRRSHIPFIAFRSAVARAATGAHIHICRPSQRMTARLSTSP